MIEQFDFSRLLYRRQFIYLRVNFSKMNLRINMLLRIRISTSALTNRQSSTQLGRNPQSVVDGSLMVYGIIRVDPTCGARVLERSFNDSSRDSTETRLFLVIDMTSQHLRSVGKRSISSIYTSAMMDTSHSDNSSKRTRI